MAKIVFALIVILSLALRIINLTSVPPSLNWDEVSHGYNAYSLLKTGSDEWGRSFPLINFRAYGDYPLPLNLYLTIPSISLLGLNELAIRLPHALLGVITTIASYYLFFGITKNRKISLFGSFLVAVDPWHLFPSRFVLQSNLSVALLTSSLALFVNGINSKKKYLLPLSFLLLGLTLFAYHTTRIFSPLLLVGILFIYRHELLNKVKSVEMVLSGLVLLLFFAPLPFLLTSPETRARANWVFIIDEGAIGKIEEKRNTTTLPPAIAKFVYNRPVYFATRFTQNYLGYFSPEFLFIKGGTHYQFSIPKFGVLYLANLIFFYTGLLLAFKKSFKEKHFRLVSIWLLLAPIPASLTQEKFAVLRSSALLPLPELLISVGAFTVLSKITNKSAGLKRQLLWIYGAALTVSIGLYLHHLFAIYPYRYSQNWQYGYKQVVSYVTTNYTKYDNIIVTKKYGEPHEFFLFFSSWDPARYRNDPNLVRFGQSDWYWVDRFDKFYFINDWEIPTESNKMWKLESGGQVPTTPKKTLLITSPGKYPPDWNKIETIRFLDGAIAFEILEKI